MPQDLGQIAAATAEYEEIAAMGVALETLLNLQGQPLHAGLMSCGPSRSRPDFRWNGDQDRSAFNVAEINADGAFDPIRILASFISTKIASGSGSHTGDGDCSVCSTINRRETDALAALRSRRHL